MFNKLLTCIDDFLIFLGSSIYMFLRRFYNLETNNVILIYNNLFEKHGIDNIINDLNADKVIFDSYYNMFEFAIIIDNYDFDKEVLVNKLKERVSNFDNRFIGFYFSREDFLEKCKYISERRVDNIIEIKSIL